MALYWPAQTPKRGLFTVEAPKFTMDNWVAINIFEKNTNFHMDLDTMCVDVQDSFTWLMRLSITNVTPEVAQKDFLWLMV